MKLLLMVSSCAKDYVDACRAKERLCCGRRGFVAGLERAIVGRGLPSMGRERVDVA
jgi:hypothetical protein